MRPPQIPQALLITTTLALAGCANTNTPTTTKTEVPFKSAAIHTHTIPAQYTCDGKNINPPLEWGNIPHNTGELLLAAIALTPKNPTTNTYTATILWAISGINPTQHKLNPGQKPPGTHTGLAPNNKRHYNICPKKHTTTKYQFMLYGIPANIKIRPNFADQPILAALTQPNTPTTATTQGAFLATYTRK